MITDTPLKTPLKPPVKWLSFPVKTFDLMRDLEEPVLNKYALAVYLGKSEGARQFLFSLLSLKELKTRDLKGLRCKLQKGNIGRYAKKINKNARRELIKIEVAPETRAKSYSLDIKELVSFACSDEKDLWEITIEQYAQAFEKTFNWPIKKMEEHMNSAKGWISFFNSIKHGCWRHDKKMLLGNHVAKPLLKGLDGLIKRETNKKEL